MAENQVIESKDQARGPNSFRSKTCKAFLAEVDWAIEVGSTKWSDPITRGPALEEFRNSGQALKAGGGSWKGQTLQLYNSREIKKMPSDLIKALGLKHVKKYAIDLFLNGSRSKYLSERAVDALKYDREREMAAMRAKSGKDNAYKAVHAPSTSPSTPRQTRARRHRDEQAAISPDAGDDDPTSSEDGDGSSSSEDDDYSFHPGKASRLDLQQKRKRRKTGRTPFLRVKPHATDARRVVCQYIDEHYASRQLDGSVTTASVCREIAECCDVKYFDKAEQKVLRGDGRKVWQIMGTITKRYNEWPQRSAKRKPRDLLMYGSQMNVDEFEENPNGVHSTPSTVLPKELDEGRQDTASAPDEDEQSRTYLMPTSGLSARTVELGSEANSPWDMDTPEVQESASQADDGHYSEGSHDQLSPSPGLGSKKRQMSDAIEPAKKRSRGCDGTTAGDLPQTSRSSSSTSTLTDGLAQNSTTIELSDDSDSDPLKGVKALAQDADTDTPAEKGPPSTIITATVYADSTEFFLPNKELRRKLQSLSLTIESAVQGAMLDLGLDGSKTATLVANPSLALKKVYRALLGTSTSGDAFCVDALDPLTALDVAFAVVGASAWKCIFDGSALDSYCFDAFCSKQLESLGSALHSFENQLQPFQTNLDTLLRRTYLDWISDPEAGLAELIPVTELLKDKMVGILLEHLEGDGEVFAEDREARQMALAKALADPVEEMTVLRCQVSCAREEYHFLWPRAKARLDVRTMESPEGEGEEVAVALFPGLSVEVEGVGKVVAKAMVRSMETSLR